MHHLLIASIGGTPDPIVASLVGLRPDRVYFVPSSDTQQLVMDIVARAKEEGFSLSPGQWDELVIAGAQDFAGAVEKLRHLDNEVAAWLRRGPEFAVAVDFTGGTKAMTAALAVVAHRWKCDFRYVGGMERTKDGLGVVVSGREHILHAANVWDTLGYQAIEDALLFNEGAYAAAAKRLTDTRDKAQRPDRKRELQALIALCKGYDAWDRFDHKAAANHLGSSQGYSNDLRSLLGMKSVEELSSTITQHLDLLGVLQGPPSHAHVLDLLGNAQRRLDQERFDDAVARCYRAVEAIAQLRLREAHEIAETKAVKAELLPATLRDEWGVATGGTINLELERSYRLLRELGDALGERYYQSRLPQRGETGEQRGSILSARNTSILAHGWSPIRQVTARQLLDEVIKLVDATPCDLPSFPTIMT